jgi:hypothetical protein
MQADSVIALEGANIGVKDAAESAAQRIEDAILTLKGRLG